nr:extracellular solute-binding protein [uncultured Acetatifactor sp.]
MKKIIALLLTAAMACGAAACGNKAAEESPADNSGESGATDAEQSADLYDNADGETDAAAQEEKDLYGFSEPFTIKVGFSWGSDFKFVEGESSENNQWMNLYREHNIMPEILYDVDSSQGDAKMSAAIMSGNYPDVTQASPSDFINYAQTDVIADITDVYEEYASDQLKEYVNADGGLSMQNCMVNGRLYGVPKMSNSYDSVPVMWIRADWLENLNLEIPETMEDLKAVAHAFTYDDPDQNGVNDTYGLALNGTDILTNGGGDASAIFAAYNAYPGTDGMAFVEGEDGKVTWGGSNAEGMKAGLQLLQDMYADGSLPKTFTTMNANSMFEETGAGRCGIWFGPMWAAMVPAGNAIKSDPKAHMIAAPIPTGAGQEQTDVFLTSSLESVFCVSSKCEKPEVLIKLLNLSVQKLCYPESEEEFIRFYGAPGQYSGWKPALTGTLAPLKNLDNYRKESAALQSGDTSELNAEQMGDYTNMKAFLDMYNSGDFDPEDAAFSAGIALYTVFGDPEGAYALIDDMIAKGAFKPSAYNSLPTDAMAENAETLKKLTVETIVKIITGDPVDSYDDFLETWYALGGEDVIADAQAWADSN